MVDESDANFSLKYASIKADSLDELYKNGDEILKMGLKEDISFSDSEASDMEDIIPLKIIKKSKVSEKLEKMDKQEKIEKIEKIEKTEKIEKFERKSSSTKKYREIQKIQKLQKIVIKPNQCSPIMNLYPMICIDYF